MIRLRDKIICLRGIIAAYERAFAKRDQKPDNRIDVLKAILRDLEILNKIR